MDFAEIFAQCTYRQKFTPYLHSRDSDMNAVFISCPEMCQDLLQSGEKYPQLYLPQAWSYHAKIHGRKRGLLFMKGEEWWQVLLN